MKQKNIRLITESAVIAAIYVVLTVVVGAFNLSSGAIQLRVSEALCILPFFTPSAIPGLAIGCLISNLILAPSMPLDIIFGTLATLIGAFFTYKIKNKWLCPIPPILSNTIIIPIIIMVQTGTWEWAGYFMALGGVFIGEVISVYVFGIILLLALEKRKLFKR